MADIFAKIDGIKGESLDSKHKDEVEILSWSWGVSQSASGSQGGGSASGKATFNDFNFTHHVDKSSPVLMRACATGEHIKEATISVRKSGKGQLEYLIIKLKEIFVTNVSPSGGSGEAADVSEHVGLKFANVHVEYKPVKPDGTLGPGVEFKFDLKANKEG